MTLRSLPSTCAIWLRLQAKRELFARRTLGGRGGALAMWRSDRSLSEGVEAEESLPSGLCGHKSVRVVHRPARARRKRDLLIPLLLAFELYEWRTKKLKDNELY